MKKALCIILSIVLMIGTAIPALANENVEPPYAPWSFDNTVYAYGVVDEPKLFSAEDFTGVDCTQVYIIRQDQDDSKYYYDFLLVLSQSGQQARNQAIAQLKTLSFITNATENHFAAFQLSADTTPLILKAGETVPLTYSFGGQMHEYENTIAVTFEIDPDIYDESSFTSDTFIPLGISEYWPMIVEGDWQSQPSLSDSMVSEQHRYCTRLIYDKTYTCFAILDTLIRTSGVKEVLFFYDLKTGSNIETLSIHADSPELFKIEKSQDKATVTGVSPGTGEVVYRFGEKAVATCFVTVYTPGDVNCDGTINAVDALQILQYAVDKVTLSDGQRLAGDVSGDEKIDAVDALFVLQYAVGLIDTFPVEKNPITPTDTPTDVPPLPQTPTDVPTPSDISKEVVEINTTNFPDVQFRQDVTEFDLNNNGWLSEYEISQVDEIVADRYIKSIPEVSVPDREAITTLKGIEYFTELKRLTCGYNALTALDVSANTKLTTLSCYYNQLTSIDVSNNTSLKQFNCNGNLLTELDVTRLSDLDILNCSNNQLQSLDVSKNVKLNWLFCDENLITELDLTQNIKLTYLKSDDDVTVVGWSK